jgi:hypothetical protein
MRVGKNQWDNKRGVWQPRITEEMVLKEIVTRLWLAKIPVYRINCAVGGKVRPNEPGIPDLVGYVPFAPIITFAQEIPLTISGTRPLFIEVKRPGGARRPAQIRFIEEASASGCLAFFAESWQDVVDYFSKAGIKL